MVMCLPPSAPPGPEATLTPHPGPGEVHAAAPPPALPEAVETPPRWDPVLVAEASGQHFQIQLQLNCPSYTCLSGDY